MKTFILPGFSSKNRTWVDETANQLLPHLEPQPIYWSHWDTGLNQDNWIEKEAQKIFDISEGKQVNIIAKSVGTLVSIMAIKNQPEIINKIILCGIPIQDFQIGDKERYEVLKALPVENIVCIQNINDNHGSSHQASQLIKSINPNTKIISKPRDDHEYPYVIDFINFLSK